MVQANVHFLLLVKLFSIVKIEKNFRWYPKCKLTSDTDDTNTKEESFSEQNDTVTIRAYPFNDKGQIAVEFDTAVKTATGLTEEKFFNQVITSDEDLKKVIAGD